MDLLDGPHVQHVPALAALHPRDDEVRAAGTTLVKIAESGWRDTPKGLDGSYQNCSGWMQMLCCLKAWAEHRINLRQGFF